MKKRLIKKKKTAVGQVELFQPLGANPVVPREVLAEVHAALIELLLDALRSDEEEVGNEREGH